MSSDFINTFNALASDVHANAVKHGFWDTPRNDGEMICLMHSELSEALEGLRHGNPPSEHIPAFTAVEEEMADCIIRIMDYAQGGEHRVAEAVVAKMAFNSGRPRMHGGKRF